MPKTVVVQVLGTTWRAPDPRLLWSDEGARAAVQSALLAAVRGWHTLSDIDAAAAWLRRLVVKRSNE